MVFFVLVLKCTISKTSVVVHVWPWDYV